MTQRITCPRCGLSSSNPNDVANGYCGNCHDFTKGVVGEGLRPGISAMFGSKDPQVALLLKRVQEIPEGTVARCEAQASLYMFLARKEWQEAALIEEREARRDKQREYQRTSDERKKAKDANV